MKTFSLWILALGAWIFLSACTTPLLPTESKIGYNPGTGLINMSLPKDSAWAWLEFHQTIGTNQISLVISNGVFKNNPLVIDAVSAGYIGMINAMGTQLTSALAAGAAGATKAVVLPVMPATTTMLPDGTVTITHKEKP